MRWVFLWHIMVSRKIKSNAPIPLCPLALLYPRYSVVTHNKHCRELEVVIPDLAHCWYVLDQVMQSTLYDEWNKDSLDQLLSLHELLSWSFWIRSWGIEKLQFKVEKHAKQSVERLNWAFWLRFLSYYISDCWSQRENSIRLMCLYFHLR